MHLWSSHSSLFRSLNTSALILTLDKSFCERPSESICFPVYTKYKVHHGQAMQGKLIITGQNKALIATQETSVIILYLWRSNNA